MITVLQVILKMIDINMIKISKVIKHKNRKDHYSWLTRDDQNDLSDQNDQNNQNFPLMKFNHIMMFLNKLK